MATPKQLVARVAEITGIPEGTVIQHDRNLSVAELRTTGGRGLAVAKVTFEDAANLLIAVAGSHNVKDSAKIAVAYKDLLADKELHFGDEMRGSSFGDALAALMEALAASPEAWRAGGDADGFIDVYIYGPLPAAKIEITRNGKTDVYRYERVYSAGKRIGVGDLQFISKFSQTTLGHVGTLVAAR